MESSGGRQTTGLTWRSPAVLLCLLTVLALLPFAAKPFHIDDPLFVWSAQWIRSHPLDPFGVVVNWTDKPERLSEVTKNPPLDCYFIALVSLLTGFNEIPLHVAFMLPACLAVVGTYLLARRFVAHPMRPALLLLVCPAFWVSATNVMCDVWMLAALIWAVEWWLRALESGRLRDALWAGFLLTAAALFKYFALMVLPLLVLHAVWRRPGNKNWLAAPAVVAVVCLIYEVWTHQVYGQGMILEASLFAHERRGAFWPRGVTYLVYSLIFTGGCLLPAALLVFSDMPAKFLALTLGLGLAFCGLGAATAHLTWPAGVPGHDWPAEVWVQGVPMAALGVGLFFVLGQRCRLLAGGEEQYDIYFLALWAGLAYLFTAYFNWVVNARSLLPMVPPAVILAQWSVERHFGETHVSRKAFRLTWVVAALVGLAVVQGDYVMAASQRAAVSELQRRNGPVLANWRFVGHWGLQYYMELAGAKPAGDKDHLFFGPRELILVPVDKSSQYDLAAGPGTAFDLVGEFATPAPRLATTVNGYALFYAAWNRPLPFSFAPYEHSYRILRKR